MFLHCLQLKVRVKGAFNSHVNIPITIGSVPYRPPVPSQYPPQGFALQPTAPPLGETLSPYPPAASQYGKTAEPYPDIGEETFSVNFL